jgi:mutator protein MutT
MVFFYWINYKSPQMYKIYINETPLLLIETKVELLAPFKNGNYLVMKATGKQKQLFQVIDSLEKAARFDAVIVHHEDPDSIFETFKGIFKILEAAGGIIENENNDLLFIFRRGFWDLPKGKIDKGETPEQAAVREVAEETGLDKVTLGSFIGYTWHTYRTPKNRILKKTWWYKMTTKNTNLTLQAEEDIEDAKWAPLNEFLKSRPRIYNSIVDILHQNQQLESNQP